MDTASGLARRIATGTLHAASGRIAGVLMWLVLTPPILSALGPDGFAVWSLTFAFTGYLNALDFGLAQGTLRQVAAARARGEPAAGGAFATLAALGYLMLGALWLLVSLLLRDLLMDWLHVPVAARGMAAFALVAGAGVFVCAGLAGVTIAALQAFARFDLANRVALVAVAAQTVGMLVSLRAGWGLEGLVVSLGLGWAVGFAAGCIGLARAAAGFRWASPKRARAQLGEAVRFGAPLQLASALWVAHGQLDKLLLPRFVAFAAITPFELGLRVITAASTFPQLLLLAIVPTAAALQAGAQVERLRDLYRRGNRYLLAAGAAVVAACFGSADRLYATWLGPGYEDAALALRGLALSAGVALASSMGVTVARGVGRTDLEAWLAGCALTVHLGVSLWLVPIHGLTGALAGLLVGHLVGAGVFLWRLAGALGWSRARVVLEPAGVPLLAAVLGSVTAASLSGVLPTGSGGMAWVLLGGVAVAGAGVAGLVVFSTRFVRWSEAWGLVRPTT